MLPHPPPQPTTTTNGIWPVNFQPDPKPRPGPADHAEQPGAGPKLHFHPPAVERKDPPPVEGLGSRSRAGPVHEPPAVVLLALWRQLVVLESYAPETQLNATKLLEQSLRPSPDLTEFCPRSKASGPLLSAMSQARFSGPSLSLSSSPSEPPLMRSELCRELQAISCEFDRFRARLNALESHHPPRSSGSSPTPARPKDGAPPRASNES